jgi:hypothetical protein
MDVYDFITLKSAPTLPEHAARLADVQAAGAASYEPPGTEGPMGVTWTDGEPVYRTVVESASMTPGPAGQLLLWVGSFAKLVRFEGYASLASDGTKPTFALNGSGFSASVSSGGEIYLYGPEDVEIHNIVFIIEYTKTA